MDIYDVETNQLIIIKQSANVIRRYLKIIDKTDLNQINFEEIKKIFCGCVKDYRIGKISLDQLSAVSNELLSCLSEKERGLEFGDVLETAADLAFYERTLIKKNSKVEEFQARLSEVLNYK